MTAAQIGVLVGVCVYTLYLLVGGRRLQHRLVGELQAEHAETRRRLGVGS